MIRIRYKYLSAGLNGKAARIGRHSRSHGRTIIWLRPGLTGIQRKAALRRLRQESSRGYGPALPLTQLVVALGLDRVRGAYRMAASVVRLHPAGSLLPAVFTGVLVTMFVLVSVRIIQLPGPGGSPAPEGAGPSGAPPAWSPSPGSPIGTGASPGTVGKGTSRRTAGSAHSSSRSSAGVFGTGQPAATKTTSTSTSPRRSGISSRGGGSGVTSSLAPARSTRTPAGSDPSFAARSGQLSYLP